MRIKDKLQHIIKNSLLKLSVEKKINEIIIETSKDKSCDYYTNIAITLAKDLHKKPEEIADNLKKLIKDDLISNLEIVYPGTINIHLNKNYIYNGIANIIEKNITYGKTNIGESRKINIDFINDDFSKELNIKNYLNAIYGDNLARILKYNGFYVEKEYYINDTSLEIDNLTNNAIKRYEDICKQKTSFVSNFKEKSKIRDTAIDLYSLYGESKLNEKQEYFKKEEISTILDNKKYELDKIRVNFDTYTNEQQLYDKGTIDAILDKLNRSGYTYFKEDELWLNTIEFNDKEDRKLIRSDGNYTYVLPLIAYHVDRLNRKYDGLIDIYSFDNKYQKSIIKPILKMINQDINKIDIKVLPDIKVITNNEELLNIENLINLIGINNIRFLLSSQTFEDNIELSIDNYLKNSKTPMNEIEEINIIIHKILSSYNKKITKVNNFSTIDSELAYIILNKLYEFEDIVIISGLKQKPNLICNYLIELKEIFNEFNKKEQIISEDEIHTNEMLNLLLAIKIVINNALDLIGIIPREEL